ncbi:HD-GYP domain-containing protein [Thermohalobacter berrensis]|uniref:Metal-dependent phosphohydrolase n=1 Tax=Thermohalobacter berrensis TaxID=99594 RepID=A0A419T3S9_9FIRM|nr:HD domain-containing phosphohydrolase [Thermohalobacter berrensis]RKD32089.1 metal-dependent phosphohydrolase [Thermohalobacter berrensis]
MINENLNINLGELLSSLSLSLDIAENRSYEHSRRTAFIAFNIARNMGLDKKLIDNIYYASFIHDIGMTGQMSSYSIDTVHKNINLKREHCRIGGEISKDLPLDDEISDFIKYHHEEWNGSGPYGLKENEIPLGAQIIHLADMFDISYCYGFNKDFDKYKVKKWVNVSKGELFNPEIADVFLDLLEKERFIFDLHIYNLPRVLEIIKPTHNKVIRIQELKKIAKAFSGLIDSKSRFTYIHSKGVAKITRNISTYMGYDDIILEKLEIAALLHDLGKLIVPNYILEKPGKLTQKEFEIIKSHPYYTKLTLNQVKGLEDIAKWAGNHHEKLNGEGYPEKLTYEEMDYKDQIIAVSDVYQALTEDRPYRKGMKPKEAISILESMVKNGHIINDVVKALKAVV